LSGLAIIVRQDGRKNKMESQKITGRNAAIPFICAHKRQTSADKGDIAKIDIWT